MSDQPRFSAPRAEWSLLGAVAADAAAYFVARGFVESSDFADPRHATIWDVLARLREAGRPVDEATIEAELGARITAMTEAGNLAALPWMRVSLEQAEDYARTVAENARARRVLRTAHRMGLKSRDATVRPDEFVNFALGELSKAAARRDGADLVEGSEVALQFAAHLDRRLERRDRIVGFSTGLRSLDARTGGLVPGEMVVIAGRPGAGKTTLAMQVAAAAAGRENASVAIFSLEMPRMQLWQRLCAARAGVSSRFLRLGGLTHEMRDKLNDASDELSKLPLRITDRRPLRAEEIAASCASMKARGELGVVVIDYLGKLEMPIRSGRENTDALIRSAVTEICNIATNLGVAVILLAQLNRNGEDRDDREPVLSDLFGSSAIEAEAHGVWILHRVDKKSGRTRLVLPKQREGATGPLDLKFQAELTRFEDPTQDDLFDWAPKRPGNRAAEIAHAQREDDEAGRDGNW